MRQNPSAHSSTKPSVWSATLTQIIRIVYKGAGMAFFMPLLFLIHELSYTETTLIQLKNPKHALIPKFYKLLPCACVDPTRHK